jgi:phosphoenolpyruvate carboxykinase (GTP)
MNPSNWQHGVFVGATMASETTAAATGNVGHCATRSYGHGAVLSRVQHGDYFGHWLAMGKRIPHPPEDFSRQTGSAKARNGKFLWPGYGENVRVLKWILERVEGRGGAHGDSDSGMCGAWRADARGG